MAIERAIARARAVRADERGFTLIELMMTAAILSVVLLAVLALLDVSTRIAPQDQERGHAIQEAQAGLYRMTRELRQAHRVVSGDADTLTVRVMPMGSSTEITVTWECGVAVAGVRRCTRQVTGGTTELVVDRIVNGSRPVFEYDSTPATNARYVRASVIVPARGDRNAGNGHRHEIVFADGFYMRNRDA